MQDLVFVDNNQPVTSSRSVAEHFEKRHDHVKPGMALAAHTVMNNPLFISQTGANSKVIPNYGTMNLTIGKHGGGSDE